MKCGICLERFDTCNKLPMILECNHILCRQCLREISLKFAVCPFGREKITKPLHKLEVNVRLLEEISRVESILGSQAQSNLSSESNLIRQSFRSNVKCLFNHLLKYVPENSVIFIQKKESKKCTFCNKLANEGSWVCKQCNFYICNACFDQERVAQAREVPAYAKCSQRHQLYLYTSATEFYTRTYGNDGTILCEICRKKWHGESWSCRGCKYDVCMQCKQIMGDLYYDTYSPSQLVQLFSGFSVEYQEALQKAYAYGIERTETRRPLEEVRQSCEVEIQKICSEGHEFVNSGSCSVSLVCNSCSLTSQKTRYQCKKCSMSVCIDCYEIKVCAKNSILCPNGHKLSTISQNLRCYLCSVCSQPFTSPALHCAECNFSLCENCLEVVRSGISRGLTRSCNKGHELRWSHDTTRFYNSVKGGKMGCVICRNLYECSGSFSCRACSFDICILCSARHLK